MKRRSLPAPAAILFAAGFAGIAAGCAGTGGPSTPSPAGAFGYGVPSPPTANYVMADTIVMTMGGLPTGDMTMTMDMRTRMDLDFASDPEGVRVNGELTIEDGSMSSDMLGDMPLPMDLPSGDIELLLNRLGETEIITMPEVLATAGFDFGSSSDMAGGIFPKWPDHGLEPGDTWVDTVDASPSMDIAEVGASMEGAASSITTYTFVGDTVIDGRTFKHIAYEGQMAAEVVMDMGGMDMVQNIVGTTGGLFLWDAERGLVDYSLATMDAEGSMDMPGFGAIGVNMVQTHHMQIEK